MSPPFLNQAYTPLPVGDANGSTTPLPTYTSGACKPSPPNLYSIDTSNDYQPHRTDSANYVSSPVPWRQSMVSLHYDSNTPMDMGQQTAPASHRWTYTDKPLEMKTFSRPWWRFHWNVQVSRRRLPRLLYAVTGALCLGLWLAVAAGFANNLQSSEYVNGMYQPGAGSGVKDDKGVLFFMRGQLNRFDQESRILNLDWAAFMVQGPLMITDLNRVDPVPVERYGDSPLVIFRDTVARPDQELQNQSSTLGFVPFRLKNPNIQPIGYLGVSDFDTINTDIGLSQRAKNILTQPEFGYPWDIYEGTITFVAADNNTISLTGRPGSGVQRLYGAIITDSLLNFKVQATTTAACLETSGQGCELVITIRLKRTGLVKFCVIVVVFINWIVTISIFLITGEALLLHRSNILDGTDILSVCFSALFALPSVRSLLPGVPGYGCLMDLMGILPNVIIVALCTTFFTNSRLRKQMQQQQTTDTASVKTQ